MRVFFITVSVIGILVWAGMLTLLYLFSGLGDEQAAPSTDETKVIGETVTQVFETKIDNENASQPAGASNITPQINTEALSASITSMNEPISFFGRVIDQDNQAIVGSKIKLSIRRWMLSPNQGADGEYNEHILQSDAGGHFQITDKTGDSLQIKAIEKDGYELSPRARLAFSYGGPAPFAADSAAPVVFRLWKKGQAEPLIIYDKFFGVIPDGRLTTFDVFSGKKLEVEQGPGAINLRITRPLNVSRRDKYDWTLTVQVVAGGILASEDEFMRRAPESGYSEKFVIEFKQTDTKWSQVVKKRFFIKTQQGVYGHFELEAYPFYDGEAAFQVRSVINPSGSRNLEYDKAVQPKPKVYE